jgi:ABC-2 type transport system ATP-binding protein
MIEIRNLVKFTATKKAVDDISFTVMTGKSWVSSVRNGAGKTTTMNILNGFLSATSGHVAIGRVRQSGKPQEAKKAIGYLPEHPPLYLDMTVTEYLRFVSELKGVDPAIRNKQLTDIMRSVRITDHAGRLIKNLSKGYRQRVGIAQAMVGNPSVLILEKPTVGSGPKQIIEIRS